MQMQRGELNNAMNVNERWESVWKLGVKVFGGVEEIRKINNLNVGILKMILSRFEDDLMHFENNLKADLMNRPQSA